MIPTGDGHTCAYEYARSLIGLPVTDLVVTDGLAALIFAGGFELPLHGWNGNVRASAGDDDANGLLEALDGVCLSRVRWDRDTWKLVLTLEGWQVALAFESVM
jgi:hypothetical protein